MLETMSPALPSDTELGEIVEQVWSSFLDGEVFAMPGETDEPDAGRMLASVSIGGEWSGHLMVNASRESAHQIAGNMFQMPVEDLSTSEVADALGEIANMVGGSVKGMVGVSATLSLPQVVLDAAALVNLDARKVVSVLVIWNEQPIEVSLWERYVDAGSTIFSKGV